VIGDEPIQEQEPSKRALLQGEGRTEVLLLPAPRGATNTPLSIPVDDEVTREERIIAQERKREREWRQLAFDLKERKFLDAHADISDLVEECRRAFGDDNIAYELVRGMERVEIPISALLLSSVVLAREAADYGIPEQRLPALSDFHYPQNDDMPKELIHDIHEHADWIADVMENPTRTRRPSKSKRRVDDFTIRAIKPVLNELSVRVYCLFNGWRPRISA